MNKHLPKLVFLIIFFTAAFIRLYGISWDQGYNLHPDERAIIMKVLEISYPQTLNDFLNPNSTWNTRFFAYGSLPFYLLKIISDTLKDISPILSTYSGLHYVGRFISTLFDLGTLCVVYFITKKISSEKHAFFSSLIYCFSTLSLQLSHFYTVDTILTFFISLILLLLLNFYTKQTKINAFLIGIAFGLSLATKISAIVVFSSIFIVIIFDLILIYINKSFSKKYIFLNLKKFFVNLIIILISTLSIYLIISPYTLLDFQNFSRQTQEQAAMTKDAFTFPYTLQYVNKIKYFYELKNIFLYGLGPVISTVCFFGIINAIYKIIKKPKIEQDIFILVLLIFATVYFFTVGSFEIGFMRYMLPIYPILCILGGIFLSNMTQKINKNNKLFSFTILTIVVLLIIVWPLSFIQIYKNEHTRISATEWINKNIPEGSSIAVEHWDDQLPLEGGHKYNFNSLQLYDPESPEKWNEIFLKLRNSDYLIIASNRLYVPLQKLTDCNILPINRCYVQTAQYYKDLFDGKFGYKIVSNFSSYPKIPIINIKINDKNADESFTVYDHPEIYIFKKI